MTDGEFLVGKSFNPGGKPEVDDVKGRTAALIDTVHEVSVDTRCMDIAVLKYEEACMWAVKAITKPLRE